MINIYKTKVINFLVVIFCVISLFTSAEFILVKHLKENGSYNLEDDNKKNVEKISLNSNGILKYQDGSYKIYNYEGDHQFSQNDIDKFILIYDESSGNYIYKDTEGVKFTNVDAGTEFLIDDEDYTGLKMSPGGKYISYFIKTDEGARLVIKSTLDNSKINEQIKTSISGIFLDWYDNESLIYYGINEDNVNGIFKYNIDKKQEELFYNLKIGFIAAIKSDCDYVFFLHTNLKKETQLVVYNKKEQEFKIVSTEISDVKDIMYNDNGVYIAGKKINDTESLYFIPSTGEGAKRLLYDFPARIYLEKGLHLTDEGDILFVGSNDIKGKKQEIFRYTKDGVVSSVSDEAVDFEFIDYVK